MPMPIADLIARCDRHADKADANGLYTIGDTLWLAARELERRIDEMDRDAEPVADPCYADFVTPDVPAGYDTILGYLAKHQPEVLDLMDDPSDPEATQRDGFKLTHMCKDHYGWPCPVKVPAPPVLARQAIFVVNAYPLDLLHARWGRP